jgi:glycosyltransferase involved in cell wall biosynthesis
VSLNCLYIHDHVFKKNKFGYFSEGKITDKIFKDYVIESDNIYVCSRMSTVDDCISSNFTKITLNNVIFEPVRGGTFPKVFLNHFLENFLNIIRLLKKSDYIVVRLPSFLGVFVLFLNIFFKKKYFVELVGDAEDSLIFRKSKKNYLYLLMVSFFVFLNKIFVKNASGIIYVTKNNLQNKYPSKAEINKGISDVILNIENINNDLDFYKKKNINGFKIGLIGSFNNEYKGIDCAIHAIHKLKELGFTVNLHILGTGRLQDKYADLAAQLGVSDSIFFDGSLAGGKAVFDWLDKLDIYIQPSKTEGLPRALLEAMSRGLPIVASNVGGIPELINPNWLIAPNDSKDLAKKIQIFMNSQDVRFQAGNENYKVACEYDFDILSLQRKEFWDNARKMVQGQL